MAEKSTDSIVLHGRVAKQVLLAAHQTCRDLGITPKSHWQAVRTVLEIAVRKLQPDMFTVDGLKWSATKDELLQTYAASRGSLMLSPRDILKAEAQLEVTITDTDMAEAEALMQAQMEEQQDA